MDGFTFLHSKVLITDNATEVSRDRNFLLVLKCASIENVLHLESLKEKKETAELIQLV